MQRKYVIPFLLACVILACNTATGVNSLIGYNTSILLQSGLSDLHAHWGYVIFTAMNFLMTSVGMMLVDRKGRRFLFILGTSGIIVALVSVGILFLRTEKAGVDSRQLVQQMVGPSQELTLALRSRRSCKAARRRRLYGQRNPERSRIAGHHLLLWRFHSGYQLCPIRRSGCFADRDHARYMRSVQQGRGILQGSVRRS